MKNFFILLVLTGFAACGEKSAPKPPAQAAPAAAVPAAAAVRTGGAQLSAAGEKNQLPDGGWFVWSFSEKPKLGMLVVKVQVFDKAGGRVKDYEVTGESGMTTMHYHDSGKVRFQLNKKGDYLFPVDVVMPGDWQVTLRLGKGGKELYAGKILFNV